MMLPILGIQLDGRPKCRDRFIEAAHVPKQQSQIPVDFRVSWNDRHGAADQLKGLLAPAQMAFNQPQKVQRIGIVRLFGKN